MINRTGFALLALGALLFSALLYAAMTYQILGWPSDTAVEPGLGPQLLIALYTIAFGLPYALYELTRRTSPLLILFLIVLIPAVHYGAMYVFLWWTAEGQALAPAIDVAGLSEAANPPDWHAPRPGFVDPGHKHSPHVRSPV